MDDLKPDNVTPIKKARKEKKSDATLKVGEIYRALSDAIKRSPLSLLPDFPQRYLVIEPDRGVRLPLLVDDDDSVMVVRAGALANAVLSYTDTALSSRADYAITPRQARDVAEHFLMTAEPTDVEKIAVVRWQGEKGLAYRRLPWTRQTGPAPTWEALLSRMTNVSAFIEWVGSLFYEDSYLQNYVWLYGRMGGDGKGAINRFLERVFGASYRSKQSPGDGKHDKFWTYGLLGARLVVFPDCDDTKFVTRGLFKSLTGGDPLDFEAKGQMSFTARIKAKYLIISNEWPALSLSPSDMRRIIYCELGPASGVDPAFEDKLWEEGGYFLSICMERYAAAYPTHGPIKTESEAIEGLAATVEEDFDEVFHTWFLPDPACHVEASQMLNVLCAEWPGRQAQQHAFRRWLERRHGIRKKKVRSGGRTPWAYIGVALAKLPPERSGDKNTFRDMGDVPPPVPDLSP